MATMSTNLIGYGAAQVFDTSRSVNAFATALAKKEAQAVKADEKFLKSLSVNSKGLRSVDIPGFTEKYNDFLDWTAQNQSDLKNPTKNPSVYQEMKTRKNELETDIERSKQALAKQMSDSKTVVNGRQEFYNPQNLNAINSLSETDIYSETFNDVLGYNLRRDTSKALGSIPLNTLHIESDVPVTDAEGVVTQTKSYAVNEEALTNAVNNHFNQYSIEYMQDFASEDAAKEFIYNDIKPKIKKDRKETIKTKSGGFSFGFGGGSTGDVNYDVVEFDANSDNKYQDLGFGNNTKEISFGFVKGENRPITFTENGEVYENVIPKAIVVDSETGKEGFVFYKPGKELSESEKLDIIAGKKSQLIISGLSDDEATIQAREYADGIEQGAEFSVSKIPVGQINVHYDGLYDMLKEGGMFKPSGKTEEETEEENNQDPLDIL